jgi:hypothetical protein
MRQHSLALLIAYPSSIWVKRDGKWQTVLHHVTLVKQGTTAK